MKYTVRDVILLAIEHTYGIRREPFMCFAVRNLKRHDLGLPDSALDAVRYIIDGELSCWGGHASLGGVLYRRWRRNAKCPPDDWDSRYAFWWFFIAKHGDREV